MSGMTYCIPCSEPPMMVFVCVCVCVWGEEGSYSWDTLECYNLVCQCSTITLSHSPHSSYTSPRVCVTIPPFFLSPPSFFWPFQKRYWGWRGSHSWDRNTVAHHMSILVGRSEHYSRFQFSCLHNMKIWKPGLPLIWLDSRTTNLQTTNVRHKKGLKDNDIVHTNMLAFHCSKPRPS